MNSPEKLPGTLLRFQLKISTPSTVINVISSHKQALSYSPEAKLIITIKCIVRDQRMIKKNRKVETQRIHTTVITQNSMTLRQRVEVSHSSTGLHTNKTLCLQALLGREDL